MSDGDDIVKRLMDYDRCHDGDVDEAADEIVSLRQRLAVAEAALARSPYDISPCLLCGAPVVCLPDGMPMCQPCAESEAALEGKP